MPYILSNTFRAPLSSRPLAVVAACLCFGLVHLANAQQAAIPDAAAQAEAKELIAEVYADLLDAKSDAERSAAARVLNMRAAETDNAPAAKYVTYDTARSLAVEAGDTGAAMDAINGLIDSFKDDSGGFLGMASASLQSLSRKARNDTQFAAVAQAGMEVAEQMIATERQEEAMDLLTRLRNAALRSRRSELTNAYKIMVDEIRTIREEEGRIADDLKAIKQNPDDPALNLTVGKYMILYRGNWPTGMTMLAKSSDEALAAVSKADLAGPSDTKSQMAVGDQWWKLASDYSAIEQRSLEERAKYWYRKALPSASGIQRSLITKRLSPPGQIKWGDLVLKPGIRTIIETDGNPSGAKPGPIAKEANWEFDKKPAGATRSVTLHFEGYLYSPRTGVVGLMAKAAANSITVHVNGKTALSGSQKSEAPVQLIKGYNAVRGSIVVPVSYIDKPGLVPSATLSLTELDGEPIAIPAEQWFHDVTR